jgi:hypothetical protein
VFCDVQTRFDVDADRWRPVLGCTVFRDPQQSFALGAAVKERRP